MTQAQFDLVFKILPNAEWSAARAAGAFQGSAVDLADGYIHLSTRGQVVETARRHFRDQEDLVIAAFETDALAPDLKWEPSRGGDLFPHLYARLDPSLAVWVLPMPLDSEGVPVVPAQVLSC